MGDEISSESRQIIRLLLTFYLPQKFLFPIHYNNRQVTLLKQNMLIMYLSIFSFPYFTDLVNLINSYI